MINKKQCFFVTKSQLEGRLDPEFYRPEIMTIEEKVRSQSNKRLRHFMLRVSSGATPSVKEEAKFYSDAENGIPFLRVQNLQTNCELSLGDVRYINKDTHENMLLRSQVVESDLLVKITGVGRMAIASVAPRGFVGNTNQHMVVIKTSGLETSEYLANYLNLDVVEKLASRRSTGGTRPALDYPALKSIPIIEGLDFSLIKEAEVLKQQKDAEAKALLDGIDDYLLGKLGIAAYKGDDNLNSRVFIISMSNISGDKWAPYWTRNKSRKVGTGIYPNISLKEIARISKGQSITKDSIVNGNYLVIAGGQTSPYNHNVCNTCGESITVSASGAYSGYVWYHNYPIFASDCTVLETFDKTVISTLYLFEVLKLKQNEIYMLQQGAGQPHVYPQDLARIKIPIPDVNIQNTIVNHISETRTKAKQLQQEGEAILSAAKAEVEKMILG